MNSALRRHPKSPVFHVHPRICRHQQPHRPLIRHRRLPPLRHLYPYWRRGSVGQDSICVVIDPFPDTEPPRPDPINTDEDRIYHMLSYY